MCVIPAVAIQYATLKTQTVNTQNFILVKLNQIHYLAVQGSLRHAAHLDA